MISPLRAPRSYRARLLLLVVAAGVVPLALIGFWLTGATARSGERLLTRRLDDALARVAADVGNRWLGVRSDLLDAAERAGAAGGALPVALDAPPGLATTGAVGATLPIELLLDERTRISAAAGAVLGAFDAAGASLLSLPFDPALLAAERFRWGGELWLTRRIQLHDPALLVVATAPLAAYTQPFQGAARQGLLLLALAAAAAILLAGVLTGRMARALEQMAAAAEDVSRGNLERRLPGGEDEVGRVAVAFNDMTESLRSTLRSLSDREALAAVGEFAASLAHEIRNPLSSIRLDLQMVEEQLPADSPLRGLQATALDEVRRLDATVAGALALARSGRIHEETIDLSAPVRAAMHGAREEMRLREAVLEPLVAAGPTLRVRGDAAALEQVALNLLLNAAQAVDGGGRVRVTLDRDGEHAVFAVRDDGAGLAEADIARVYEPLFSTRPGGTGLGLPISRRIVLAHGGEMRIRSQAGSGTTVEVRIPLEQPAANVTAPDHA